MKITPNPVAPHPVPGVSSEAPRRRVIATAITRLGHSAVAATTALAVMSILAVPAYGDGPPTVTPDAGQLPGTAELSNLSDGIAWVALWAGITAIVIGAIMWAFGALSQHGQGSRRGREFIIAGVLCIVIVGGLGTIGTWAFHVGSSIQSGTTPTTTTVG